MQVGVTTATKTYSTKHIIQKQVTLLPTFDFFLCTTTFHFVIIIFVIITLFIIIITIFITFINGSSSSKVLAAVLSSLSLSVVVALIK